LNDSHYKSFLNGEKTIVIVAAILALIVMTVLFIAPVFIAGNEKFHDLEQMTIVSRVVLPLRLSLVIIVIGTLGNAVFHLVRLARNAGKF
jgi:hypothetical protein